MKVAKLTILVMVACLIFGCSGGPTDEKPTGQIDKGATDLSTAKPSSSNDKFNRYNAPD